MSNVYALIRVSSNEQDFNSQMQGIENYCRENNIILPESNIIKEYAVSGFKTKLEDRQGLQQLIQLAMDKQMDKLIVFNQDRIGRRLELLSFLSIMTENNVEIVSVTEGILNDNSDTSDLLQVIKLWTASYESKKTSVRVKNGKLKTSKDGKFNGGRVNLGYKVVNNKLQIDEDVAPIIRTVYLLYINEGTTAAKEYLNYTLNLHKSSSSIIQLLRNQIYKGVYNHNKNLYSEEDYNDISNYNKDLQIVSTDIWNKAIELMGQRRTSLKGNRCKALNRSTCQYEGLLEHICGNKLTIDYSGGRMIFKCRKCKGKDIEHPKSYSSSKLIPKLDNAISQLFTDLNKELLEEKYLSKVNVKLTQLKGDKKRLESEIQDKQTIINNTNKKLQQLLLADADVSVITVLTDTISANKQELQELQDRQDKLYKEIKQAANNSEQRVKTLNKFIHMKDIYNIADFKQKRQILRLIIDTVVVQDYDNITIKAKLWD